MPEPFPPILTPRLLLRCVVPGDAPALAGLMTPAISRWVASWPAFLSPGMAAARIEASRKAAFAGDLLPLAMVERVTGATIGWIQVTRSGEDVRRAKFGYWLGEAHHGRGLAREAAPAALAAGFRLLDVDAVDANAQPANAASIAILHHCGMTFVGQRQVHAPARDRYELCDCFEKRRPSG